MKQFQFEPKLSLDGVALMLALVGLVFWFGGLKEQVSQVQRTVDIHGTKIDTLVTAVAAVQDHQSVLEAVVEAIPKQPM